MPANPLLEKITPEAVLAWRQFLLSEKKLSSSSIDRKLVSVKRFCEWSERPFKYIKESQSNTNNLYYWYRQILHYGTVASFTYLGFLLLFQHISPDAITRKMASLGRSQSPWTLHARGRAIEKTGKVITTPFTAVFTLYDAPNGGTILWQSIQKTVAPGPDGTLSVTFEPSEQGNSALHSDLYFRYPELYLEPIVIGQSLKLERIAVATAAQNVALEKPAPTPLLALDEELSKKIGDTLGVETEIIPAQLNLVTAPFSSGSITLAPDAEGTIKMRLSNPGTNSLDIQNSNLTEDSLINAYVGNDSTTYNLLNLQSGAEVTPRFTVDALGNALISGVLTAGKVYSLGNLEVNKTITTAIGSLTLAPYEKLELPKALINSSNSNDGHVLIDDGLKIQGTLTSQQIINQGALDTDTLMTLGETKLGNEATDTVAISGKLQLSQDSAVKPVSNTWTVASDRRLKENIQVFRDGLNVLKQINPVSYILNGKGNLPQGTSGIGVIAQEVKDIIPYTIDTFKAKLNQTDAAETEFLSFNSSALTFVLINAVRELDGKISKINPTEPITTDFPEIISTKKGSFASLIAQDATVSGNLYATRLKLGPSVIANPAAAGEAISLETDEVILEVKGNASVSGSLYADEIITRDGKLSSLIDRVKSYLDTEKPSYITEEIHSASFSAILAQLNETPVYTSYIEQEASVSGLTVAEFDHETMKQWFSDEMTNGILPSSILVGSTLYISNETIDTEGTLYLQRFAKGKLDIMNGQMVIDTNGDIFVNRNLSVLGVMKTNTIAPLPQSDLTIDLSNPIYNEASDSSDFATLLPTENKVPSRFGELIIKGIGGAPVATIDASGSALFQGDIAAQRGIFNKLIIASPHDDLATQGQALRGWETTSNASTGTGVLKAGETLTRITSNQITDKSLIYLTPLSSTDNQVLYVKSKRSPEGNFDGLGYFDVVIDQTTENDINFNWWVVN